MTRPKKGTREAIGQRIREIRNSTGKTQTEAGGALDVTWQQFAKYETGRNRISADALAKLARFFRVEPSAFFE